jgi:hypothetical protein
MCIKTNSQPSGAGCPMGGSHSWSRTTFSFLNTEKEFILNPKNK